jgi:hypothetical protein
VGRAASRLGLNGGADSNIEHRVSRSPRRVHELSR